MININTRIHASSENVHIIHAKYIELHFERYGRFLVHLVLRKII